MELHDHAEVVAEIVAVIVRGILSAKVLLDAEPGSFETVRQLLGHKSLKTTVGAYAGIDSRRAARHHQRLIEQALSAQVPAPRRKGRIS
jgi:acid phosphatase family membrane protein YuiD